MGNLAHLTGGIERIREKLAQADALGLDLTDLLGKKFTEVNDNIGKSLATLVEQASQSQSRSFQSAVQQAVLNITQSQQIMLNSNVGVLQELLKLKEELSGEVGEIRNGVGSSSESLSGQISEIAKGIERLPTSFPQPEKVDLSKVLNGIRSVHEAVKSIPAAPEAEDLTPLFTTVNKGLDVIQKKLDKRVHVFEIERVDDMIKTITVRTK